jgi:hypothetical protein
MSADYSDTLELGRRLFDASEALAAMTGEVAVARQVVEYDSDRRRRVLAIAAAPLIAAGASVSAADAEARASATYQTAMKQLGLEYIEAQKVLTTWEANKIRFEAARSMLSAQKEVMKNL